MSEAARLVDELTTLLYEVLKRWEVQGRVCEIVRCGACRRKADRAESVVHESDCPVYRLIRAEEANTAVIRANAEEIADLEDKRDELEARVNALTAQMECRNELTAHIRALEQERDESVLNMTQTAEAFARLKVKSEAWNDDSKRLHNEYLPTIRIIDELLEIKDQAIKQAWAERDAALARAEAAEQREAALRQVVIERQRYIHAELHINEKTKRPRGAWEKCERPTCSYARAALAAAAPGDGEGA